MGEALTDAGTDYEYNCMALHWRLLSKVRGAGFELLRALVGYQYCEHETPIRECATVRIIPGQGVYINLAADAYQNLAMVIFRTGVAGDQDGRR